MTTNEPLKSLDEIKRIVEEQTEAKTAEVKVDEPNAVVPAPQEKKSITAVSIDDVKVKVDDTKSVAEQVDAALDLITTAEAIKDENVAKDLKDSKAKELKANADRKRKAAEADALGAETDKQKAKRDLYETVLGDFGIKTHLPSWLMVILVVLFSPFYIAKSLVIGVPLGFVKTIIDNLDNVICRYEKVGDTVKPKIKVIVWILFGALVLGAVALIVLKCLKII